MVKVGGGRQLLSDDQFEIETKQMYSLKVTIVKHRIKLNILNTERVTISAKCYTVSAVLVLSKW